MNEKVLLVMDKLREQWEITPQGDQTAQMGIYGRPRESRTAYVQYIVWLNELPLDFFEFESILRVLQDKKVIERFLFVDVTLEIKYVENFDEKYLEIVHGKKVKIDSAEEIRTVERRGKGLFKFKKEIPIAKIDTAKFQLLKLLCNPDGPGIARSLESTFDSIKTYLNTRSSSSDDSYMKRDYKERKVQGVIKELQRIFSRAKINSEFKFYNEGGKVWLKYLDEDQW